MRGRVKIKKETIHSESKSFETERALVNEFVSTRRSGRSSQKLLRTEFDATNGRADIVQISLRQNWHGDTTLGKIQPRWAYTLKAMPYRRRFSTAAFEKLTGTTRSTARAVIKRFVDLKYCKPATKPDHWIKQKQPVPLIREIVSIEAKLRNWRRALSQAYRYLDYAHRSWVLLDASHAKSAIRNLDQFKRLNVGLVTLHVEGTCRTWFRPIRRQPKSTLKYWHANAELGRRLLFQIPRVVAID